MRKGTGPRTEQGKARSKRNSITHGIFSDLLVQGESKSDFDAFHNALRKDLRPKGALGEMLVSRLTHVVWQLRRAAKAEVAEIQAATEFVEWHESERNRLEAARLPLVGCGLTPWIANPEALQGCLDLLNELKESIVKDGFHLEYDKGILTKLYGSIEERPEKENWKKTLFDSYLSWFTLSKYTERERKQNGCASPQECTDNFLKELNDQIQHLERYREESRAISARKLQVELLRHNIPEGPRLDQLLRYAAAKSREIERILDRLERMQSDVDVPPPINVRFTTVKD